MSEEPARVLEPWQKEGNWQSAAFAALVVTVVPAGFALIWAFDAETDRTLLYRFQILAVWLATGGAAVTFCTVIWRGLITSRQAELQQKQIDKLAEQIKATMDNNFAKLLLDGAEMLADEKPAKVAAGLVALAAVTREPRRVFSTEALNLILDYIAEHGLHSHAGINTARAIEYFNAICLEQKFDLTRRVEFWSDPVVDFKGTEDSWMLVKGDIRAFYNGGHFKDVTIPRESASNVFFYHVTFMSCVFELFTVLELNDCSFIDCKFSEICVFDLKIDDFGSCDFSETIIEFMNGDSFPDLRARGNSFDPRRPPVAVNGGVPFEFDWNGVLIARVPF